MRNKKKLNIGIDIDGVICDLVKDILVTVKSKYKISLKKKDIYKHEIHEIVGVPLRSFNTNVFKKVLFKVTHPVIKDAPYYINKLAKMHNITIVTSRPKETNVTTKEWFSHNRIIYHKLINIDKDKHAVLEKFDFFIDDNLKEIISASSINGLNCILFDQPWNKSYNIRNLFIRVRTWREIYFIIQEYSK